MAWRRARPVAGRGSRGAGLCTAQLFRVFGWVVEIEVSFARFGERGSIDILAWHGQEQALLVVEVKTELASVEGLLRTIDVKVRLAPEVAHQRFGWQPRVVGRLVVLPEDRTARRRVARHAGVLDVALPTRSREVRNWLKMPQQPMAGLWFLTHAHGSHYAKSVSGPARAQPFLTSNACLSDVPRGDARTFRSA